MMKTPLRRALLAAALLLSAATVASADEAGDLGITIRTQVQVGQRPAVLLKPSVGFRKLDMTLTADGTSRGVKLSAGPTGAGSERAIEWSQPVGSVKWDAKAVVTWEDGSKGEFGLTFETAVFPKIHSVIHKEDVDLKNHTLTARLNQPAAKAELVVTGDDGKVMHQGEKELLGAEAGTDLVIDWEQPAGIAVLKIELKLWSTFGFWSSIEITPFEVEIPHEEVIFATGDAVVRPSEAAKLQHTLVLLNEKIDRYGGLLELQLYVGGYTDTVGSKGSNQELSERRARAIGAWFKAHGLKLPVYYQGFGEDAPAVATPDETDRAENRRALYVLSASAPAKQASVPRSNWSRL